MTFCFHKDMVLGDKSPLRAEGFKVKEPGCFYACTGSWAKKKEDCLYSLGNYVLSV